MLEFEDQIPKRFRTDEIVVKTVGQLIDELSQLPRDLPMSGEMCNGMALVRVTQIVGFGKPNILACDVEGFHCNDDEDDDWES